MAELAIQRHGLSIVHVNTHDNVGGAAKVAWRLMEECPQWGHHAEILCGYKLSNLPCTSNFDIKKNSEKEKYCIDHGWLYYQYEGSHELINHPRVNAADVLHFHNLHGAYFNPWSVSALSHFKPVVWTLHDMQSITGYCAHSLDCEKWRTGCGNCPNLNIYPKLAVDNTAQLIRDKRYIYQNSFLQIVTPSDWLRKKLPDSILRDHPVELIYNGCDTNIFKPYPKTQVRQKFGIPQDAFIVGAVSQYGVMKDPWKGGKYTQIAWEWLKKIIPNALFLNIGAKTPSEDASILNIAPVQDESLLAQIYNALDVFLYTPIADTCPLVVIETLSCGVPIVTFDTGGVPELVRDKMDGFVFKKGDTSNLVCAVKALHDNRRLGQMMGQVAREGALQRFSMECTIRRYIDLYYQCIERHRTRAGQVKYFDMNRVPQIIKTPDFLSAQESKNKRSISLKKDMSLQTTSTAISILNNPDDFTYSKWSQFARFLSLQYDDELYNKKVDIANCDLKRYQDLLVFAFIKNHIPKGSRILDVGGANSRILKHFYKEYECWNIDKLEGLGSGVKSLDPGGRYRLVQDYMGNFNKELPDNYFDFVFSISALEHTPKRDEKSLMDVRDDMNRVLKPGGYSLHCFDILIQKDSIWTNPLLPLLFKTQSTLNHWVPLESLQSNPDLYFMSEATYDQRWKKITQGSYQEFGKPLSYNVLWQKATVASCAPEKTPVVKFESNSLPILVYQMGKVGSATIKNSLNRLNIANEHVHFLTPTGFRGLEQYYQENPHRKVSSHVLAGRKVRAFMDSHPQVRWKVISLVRDPIARFVSSYFQNYVAAVCQKMQSSTQEQIADHLVRFHQDHFAAFDENKDQTGNWFDQEIKEVFGFDVFSQPFDTQQGYQIYHCPKADILVLQLEKLDTCAGSAFREFLGIEDFQLVKKNTAEEKDYRELYDLFLKKFKLSQSVLNTVYSTRYINHFYPPQQIHQFCEKWIDGNTLSVPTGKTGTSILERPDDFTWSKVSHFASFKAKQYDIQLYGKEIDVKTCILKAYQDLLVYAFIRENVPKGSRILDVGGGDSRILRHFYRDYECWNIDKLEGLGNGLKSLDPAGRYRLVQDYMGNFNKELPDHYFDFVFSISALEHVPEDNPALFEKIRDDINRVLKPGGYSLHCFDSLIKKNSVWTNPLLPLLFKTQPTLNSWIPLESLASDSDLYFLNESVYNQKWKKTTQQPYEEFGKPLSYNVLWQKAAVVSPVEPIAPKVVCDSTNKYPRITVVTPSYNQAAFLEQCIQSILGQNYPNLEYIIMDGGSTDGSVEIIRKYEKHLAYWQSCPDGGQYKAVEEGFRRSTGQILTWLNSDDILRPQALFKVAAVFSARPDIQWLTGRPNTIHADGSDRTVRQDIPGWSRERYLHKQYKRPYIQQEGTFWARALWEKAGARMHPDFDMAGDLELWARFFRHTQLYTVDALLGAFRHQPAQKTKRIIEQYFAEAEIALDYEIVFYNQSADKILLPAPQPISADELNQLVSSFTAFVGEKSPVNTAIRHQDSCPILLATSLAPGNIENQQRAVQSWLDCGFDVISVNNPGEIQKLAPYFGKVRFIPVSHNGRELYGKPLVYIDDILGALKASKNEIVGIINSDIHLRIDAPLREKIRRNAAGSLVYVRRINVDYLGDPNGEQSEKGIDLFVMDRSVLEKMPSSRFCLGTSWWDCYFPLFCGTTGIPLKWFNGRFAFHIKHTLNWDHEQWVQSALHFFDCLYHLSLQESEPSLLSEMEKQWLAFRMFYQCLRGGIVVRKYNKQVYLGSQCVHAIINQATQIIPGGASPTSAAQMNAVSCSDRDGEQSSKSMDYEKPVMSIQPKVTLVDAMRFFRAARDASAVGNLVTARRLMAQYQARMDCAAIPAIDRRTDETHPLISVIISACRGMDHLSELLNCLAAQTFGDFEVIVVDNGSLDISAAAQKVHCVIPSLVDGNPTEGRNIGVHFARGQIAVFVDGNALIGQDYLASVSKAFETNDILGLRGRILPKTPTGSQQNSAWDRGDKPFPTLCNQEGNAAFLVWAWRIVCGADPLLNGHEGTDLSWRLMQAFGRNNAIIYWPGAVVYYDSRNVAQIREKETQYKTIRNYLLYKYDCSIYSLTSAIEKLAITAGNSLTAARPMFVGNAGQWRSLCYIQEGSRAAAIAGPKVSVVISCFNAAEYLRECLDSVQAQTLTDWEAIIVDDGSTDDTHNILKDYAAKDSRFHIYLNTDNKGPYVRRNFALSRIRAPFIAIHDADDIMAPQRLEILLDEILKDDQLAIVGSFYGWFMGTFRGIEYCDVIPISVTHAEIMNTFSRTRYICCHAAAIIRKTFLDCIGLYDQQPWGADTFWLTKAGLYSQLTGQVRFKNIPECLSFIRKHGNSQTGKINPNDPRNRRQYLASYYLDKLQRIVGKKKQLPDLDVGRELQECTCRDFIPQYGHLFSQWESVPVTADMLRSKLNRAVEEFSRQSYVKAAIFCDTLCQMSPGIEKTFRGFNLIRGLSHFACGEDASARRYLEQEYADHKTIQALRFFDLYMNHQNQPPSGSQRREIVDSFVFAYPEIAEPDAQVIYDNRDGKTPQVSVIMDCRQREIDFGNLINTWSAQSNSDFELILINSQSKSSDFACLSALPISLAVVNIDEPVSTAAAKNIAVSHSCGGIILFVSPQVTVDDRLLQNLAEQMNSHKISALRGRIAGSQEISLNPEYNLGDHPLFCSTDTDMLCAVRREVLDRLGPLDTGVFENDLLYLSAKIYGQGYSSEPVLYDPQWQAALQENTTTSNYLLCTLGKEQLFWRLSAPQWYQTFMSFTESESGGLIVIPGIQFPLRQRFPWVVLDWIRRAWRRIPDSENLCYLLADLEWELGNYDQAAEFYERLLRLPCLEPVARQILDEKTRQIHAVSIEFYLQSCLRLIEFHTLRKQMDIAGKIAMHVLSNKNLAVSPHTVGWIENLLQTSKSLYPSGISDLHQETKWPQTAAY